MELFDKHFGNTKEAFLRLHENFEELKAVVDGMKEINDNLEKRVQVFEMTVDEKIKEIENVINRLSKAVE